MSAVAKAARGWFGQPRDRRVGYAFCSEDRFWFRPVYTEGRCPLCGEFAVGGASELSPWARVDRFALGLGALVLVAVAMTIVVLVVYFG